MSGRHNASATPPGAVPLLMESEAGLYDFGLTRFLHANRIHPRVKPEDMLRSKTL
jgi:hypothetical protein